MKNLIKFTVLPALLFVSTLTFANTPVDRVGRTITAPTAQLVIEDKTVEVTAPAVVVVSPIAAAVVTPVTCEICVTIIVVTGCVSWCCANCDAVVAPVAN